MKNTKKTFSHSAGFTLVEIMAVVLIIGLLAGVLSGPITRALFQGNKTRIQADIKSIQSSIKLYKGTMFRFPESLEELIEEDPPFVEGGRLPTDPWGREYFYNPPSGGSEFEVGTYGMDGMPGGEGDDSDVTNLTLLDENS
jgi:general secretion pathway protein G